MRGFLHIVLPLLLPALLYLLWAVLMSNRRMPEWWAEVPWVWVGVSGAVLMAISLTWWALVGGDPPGGVYHPPEYRDGEIVPSYIE